MKNKEICRKELFLLFLKVVGTMKKEAAATNDK